MDFDITLPEGQKFKITGPAGSTPEQAAQILQQQIAAAPNQDPEMIGFDPHREEGGAAGGIYQRAGAQLLPSAGRAAADIGSGLWNLVTHPKEAWKAINETYPEDVFKSVKNDLTRHYGSWDRAQKTFETDPTRFILDLVTLGTGGAALGRKLIQGAAEVGKEAIPRLAGRISTAGTENLRLAGEAGAAGGVPAQEFRAGIGGRPSPSAAAMGATVPAAAAQPYYGAGQATHKLLPAGAGIHTGIGTALELGMRGRVPGWLEGATMAAGAAGSSPRLMGETMYGLGKVGEAAAQPGGLRRAGWLGAAEVTRDQIQQQAQEALKDKEFKKGKTSEQLNPVRKVARDPNADSKAMTAAQRVLGGYRPLKLTVTPEEGAYGGPDAGVPSRQEGGPVTAGRAYSVGDAPGATPDTPKPETFVPDRGPSPAQAAGAAATEGMGWISDAWASILKGEKPPPLPALPEAGKVPSTADPRPTQALGEETAAIAQLAGPPGAAAAKGLGAAALGAAAGKKLLKGAAEEAPRALTAAEKAAPLKDAPFPQYATEYPPIAEPVMTWDAKKGRYYPAKGESPEAAAFLKARDKIREQMKTEGYTPYFDPAKRVHADPEKYPARTVETLDIAPVRREALDKHLAALNAPEVRKRLRDAIKKGQNLGDTADWYAMGQLESEFTKEFGAKEGRTRFLDTFAAPMAATTGGMDPTGNLLLASYLNYLRAGGRSLPTESWQVPKGFGGGKYGVMPNIKQYQTKMEGGGYSAFGEENPKRLDFMRAFLGDRYHPVMDEQMTQGMTPGLSQPPPGTYGLYAKKAIEVGKEQGLNLTPDDVQAIAWAGFKDEAGKPMISHFNDAVERTYRLTGMPRQEIVRRWMRKEIPLYGGAGATIMAPEMAREATGDRQ